MRAHRFGPPPGQTPSQTAGPYVHIGLTPRRAGFEGFAAETGAAIAGPEVAGERIRVEGMVLDGAGAPVRDAVVEVWQADPQGRYPSPADPRGGAAPGFCGFGRAAADFDTGAIVIETVKPGPVPAPGGTMAPHLALWIVARGINTGLLTRMLFADEAEANAACPFLARIEPERRETLIAETTGPGAYRFTIRLQGPGETVFLEV